MMSTEELKYASNYSTLSGFPQGEHEQESTFPRTWCGYDDSNVYQGAIYEHGLSLA